MPNLEQKLSSLKKILSCLNIASLKKKWIFKQSAAPTLATLTGAATGRRPLAARGLAGKSKLANNGKFNVLLQSTFDLPQE